MAVLTTYQWPLVVQGGTVAPTASQVGSLVTALFSWGDADTTATITHNFGLSAAELAAQFPITDRNLDASTAGTINPLSFVAKAANTITFTKASAAGSNATYQVFIERPHSIFR